VDPSGAWLTGRPDEEVITPIGVTLHRASQGDLAELVESVNASLDELRPWMPWARDPATRHSIGGFLDQADLSWESGAEFQFAIRGRHGGEPRAMLGFCGLHNRIGPGGLEIGYWVRSDCTGRGVATAAAAGLCGAALAMDGVSRVEIHCDAGNTASAAIPPKLGFHLDRIEDRSATSPGTSGQHMIWVYRSGAAGGPGPG
jgi:RimJ/RimL family protein N-acetyltransferase